jgi:hypothetical protein
VGNRDFHVVLGVERALLQFVGLLVDCVDLKRDVEPLAVGVADGTELIVRACRQARHLRPEFTLGLDQRNAVGFSRAAFSFSAVAPSCRPMLSRSRP